MQCAAQAEQSEAESQPEAEAQPDISSPSPEETVPPYKLILALAAGGIAETAYLTLVSPHHFCIIDPRAFASS